MVNVTNNIRKYIFPFAVVCMLLLLMGGCKKNGTYTIIFDANGGTGTMEPQIVKYGEQFTLKKNVFTRENYVFVNWNSIPDGSGLAIDDEQTYIASSNSELTLYAQWERNTAIVTFNANGGTGEMTPQTFTIGTPQVLSANSFAWENHEFIGWNSSADGTGKSCFDAQEITIYADVTLYAQWMTITGQQGGHCYVDLGLPSGTKWATCNVGANTPEECGDYFAWGETTTKETYNLSTYRWSCNDGDAFHVLTKYCNNAECGYNGFTDALTTLNATDDATIANWGAGWRMPSYDEMVELINNCTVTWTIQNGVNGSLFSGPNGNSIFMPAAGYSNGSSPYATGPFGSYWSSSLYTDFPYHALILYFTADGCCVSDRYRYWGFSVRPVLIENN